MREGELLYFTPAEFVVMMELAGTGKYSMVHSDEPELDNIALIQAFSTLFQRELIQRKDDGFILSDSGRPFQDIRSAQFVVLLSAVNSHGFAAACYVTEKELWLVEFVDNVLSKRYRLQMIERKAIKEWFFNAGILEPPILSETDTAELGELFKDKLTEPSGNILLRLERFLNGGASVCAYEILEGKGIKLVVRSDHEGCAAEIYTVEALSRMLTECFRKE